MSLWSKIKNFFSPIIRSFWGFLKQVFSGSVEIILAQLKDIAIQAVEDVGNDPDILTDSAKRKEAFRMIKEDAELKGVEARDSIINLAIELAVQYIKNQ